MGEKNNKEQLYRNLIVLFKLFNGRPLHLAKYLIENDAFDKNFIDKITNNDKLSTMNEGESESLTKAIYFLDISHMKDYFNSMLDESSKVESKRDMTKELNEKLDKFIKEEKFEDAIRIRDYMEKNNIERRE
jgi:anaerobic selenocysteine-containing dehydrogenase